MKLPNISDVVAFDVRRPTHEPLRPSGIAAMLPDVQTSIEGQQIADICSCYLDNRGTSKSVRLGKAMAERVL